MCIFIEYNLDSSAYKLLLASNGFNGIILLLSLCGLRCRIYISAHPKKTACIESEGFSTLEKNTLICYQRAMLPIHLGVTALCR
jgi:hypothetical protein